MIKDLLNAMSTDMKIYPYRDESDESFAYRLCYSAIGQWCLTIASSLSGQEIGTTKHNQTIVLNELMLRYSEMFPFIIERFTDKSIQPSNFPVFIRRVYEETGYLLTDSNNHNRLANFGRSIKLGAETLFFGHPSGDYAVNGLGVFATLTEYAVTIKDFIIRDNLTCEEYLRSRFDPIDFYERDVDINELEVFNPLVNGAPSHAWRKTFETEFSVARRFESGPYYRIMQTHMGIKFADEPIAAQSDSLTSYEYRRLYFAMKNHYGNPLKVWVTKIDELYSKIRMDGHLPNREYYFLLLLSWPERSAFDKVSFIIRTNLLDHALATLENIGLKVEGGRTYE